MSHHTKVADPRDPTGEHCLAVEYDFIPGCAPFYNPLYGGDPGWPPSYRIHEAVTKRDRCVLAQLTAPQQTALYDAVHGAHDRA
ncbi:MAG: hypothetical protein PGN33_22655 [Methylobacterium radiotolerans]